MADRTVAMLRDSLKAFIEQDIAAARQICEADDEVDRLQDRVYEDSTAAMIADPSTIQRNTYMLWTAHNLERIAASRDSRPLETPVFFTKGSARRGVPESSPEI